MQPLHEDNDPLWKLLAHSKAPSLPTDFTDRVLASIESRESSLRFSPLLERRPFRLAALVSGVAALVLAVLHFAPLPNTPSSPPLEIGKPGKDASLASAILSQGLSEEEIPLLAHLDELIDPDLAWHDSL